MLEEGSFRGRTADFVFMFLFGGFLMTVSFGAASGSLVSPDMVWTCRACLQPPCPGCAVEQGPPEQHSWFVNPLGASGQRASCPRPAQVCPVSWESLLSVWCRDSSSGLCSLSLPPWAGPVPHAVCSEERRAACDCAADGPGRGWAASALKRTRGKVLRELSLKKATCSAARPVQL